MSGAPRILILGSTGQVGSELQKTFADVGEILTLDRRAADLGHPESLRKIVRDAKPDVILNAAAYTAVDRAESEPEAAKAVNATAPKILAEEALRSGAILVHYSTDYVFDGTKAGPWIETDPVHPLNVYGASKLAGEQAITQVGGKFLIFRTSWVYGPRGSNFFLTMLRLGRERDLLKIVDDQIGAPTTSLEIARATCSVVNAVLPAASDAWAGTYHMTCGGSVSWCGFAKAIFAQGQRLLQGKTPQVLPIQSSDYPTPAKRPLNSVLSNEKLFARFKVRLPIWDAAMEEVLESLAAPQLRR
ncbi:MAG TPA: dTDP-4-dehydrorhamnose reductase [Terracidiphilus sp.]|nr:dTDP-4-dehydrorhamnose reductase [Terracidiphilus sp.]